MNIADVINYVLVRSKFGLLTVWGWHRRAETWRSGERPYF